jgi:hypothetical protein
VTTWQTSDEFMFEFHPGHTTGYPIYIRPAGNTDSSNVPKIDTKNKFAYHYAAITDIANDGKLTSALSNTAQTELLAIIQAEWASLVTLARRYWEDSPVTATRKTATEIWADEEGAETGQHNMNISIDQLRKILGHV